MLCLKSKQNTETSDEEHSDSKCYYPEEEETAEKNVSSRWHFDKVEASGDIPGGLGIATLTMHHY